MSYPEFMDYGVAVSRGLSESGKAVTANYKFGRITALSTANITVWNRNTLYAYPASATTMRISSSSVADATTGTGAVNVQIDGVLDGNTSATEIVELTGQTPVTLTSAFLRINRAFCMTTGSGNVNAGNITIWSDAGTSASGVPTTTTEVYSQILANEGQTQNANFRVPNGFTAYMTHLELGSGQTKFITAELFSRKPGQSFRIRSTTDFNQAVVRKPFNPPLKFSTGTDIELRARASSTAGIMSGEYNLILAEGDN